MGLGALLNRSYVNVNVTTTNEAGTVLGADVYTVTDGLIPSWAASPYRGAMNLPGAWRAAIIAADLLGSFPWEAYERGPLGVPVLAKDQPVVLTQPAPPDAGITTVSSFGLDYIWHGNAVALLGPRNAAGDVEVMAPVPIANVAIGRSNGKDLVGFQRGEVGYRIGNRVYHADEVLHLKGPCEPGALRGLGALEVHLSGALRTGLELQRQAGNLDIAGVPTGTLKVTAPDLTEDEAILIKAKWLAAQSSRTVAVLNDITEFQPLAWNPTETQLLEARKFSLHEIALIVGVPLYFLGVETSNRTYSNVEQEGIVLTRFHLAGAIRRMEAAYTGCMRPGRYVLADLSDALRADTLTRYQAWQIGAAAGFLTPNEIRGREGLGPIAGGDKLVVPAPAPGANPASKPDTGPPEIGEAGHQQGRALDGDDLGPVEFAAVLDIWLAEEVRARGGGDPDGSNLKAYWTTGAGRGRWSTWTELYGYLSPDRAKRTAAQWFHDVKGFWPNDRRNRGAEDWLLITRGRYNPRQPRDSEGKFAETGAGGVSPRVTAAVAAARVAGLARKPKTFPEVNRIADRLGVDPPHPSASRGWSGDQWGAYWATVLAGGDADDGVKVAQSFGARRSAEDLGDLIVRTLLQGRGRHSFDPDQPRDQDGKWGAGGGSTNMFGMSIGQGATGDDEDGDDGEPVLTERPGDVTADVDRNGRPIEIGRNGAGGVRIPEVPPYDGYGGGGDTGLKRYKLDDEKFCPECGGKAQDPQYPNPEYSAVDFAKDGTPLWSPDDVPEKDDSPYHDPSDPEYAEDK